MNNASLELGGANWAEKDASLLGYTVSDDSGRFFPQEFTFSRGSNLAATRIGKTGLIEKGRENLLLQSNQFDTTWTVAGSTITDGQSGYDGSNNAWLLSKSSASGNLGQNTTSNGVTTFSVYAKANASLYLRLIIFDGTFAANGAAYFDLQNGALGTTNAIDSNIESVGNGWYRCSVSFNTSNQRVYIYPAEANSTTGTTGSIYIQDAQLELGLSASPYIPTTTTTAQAGVLENTPRLNYTTGVANPSLLLEPSRTNLIRYSEYIDGLLKGGNPTLSIESETNPSGNAFAYKVTATATNSRIQDSLGPKGNNFVFSGFFKGTGTATRIYFVNNQGEGVYYDIDTNGTFTLYSEDIVNDNYGIDDYGNGWHRIYFETTTSSVSANYIQVFADALDGDGSVFIWGLQAEQGSYPTSYIPTYSGQSATRAQDVCIKTDATGEINSTEGVLFIEGKVEEEDSFAVSTLSISDGTDSNRLSILQYRSSPLIRASMNVGGATQFDMQIGGQTRGLYYKIAAVYSENNCSLFINGVKIGNDTSATMPSPNTFNKIGFVIAADQYNYQGNVKQVLLYPTALTDAEVITLTTP